MRGRRRLAFRAIVIAVAAAAVVAAAVGYLRTVDVPVLEPKGTVGLQELHLILFAAGLSLLVVVPVYALAITFAVRYREGNARARYEPGLEANTRVEVVWWGIPTLLIVVLSVVTWTSSQALDPYRPLSSSARPLTVQVVALDWKWLFIYPDQHIAAVNQLVVPTGTPVKLLITADAPMNAFWIPQLGSQIYAMPGMQAQLNLDATTPGAYTGLSANLSGIGFSSMSFETRCTSQAGFQSWIATVRASPSRLDESTYAALAVPAVNPRVSYYIDDATGLFDSILAKEQMMAAPASAADPPPLPGAVAARADP
ncbi:MAG TPA: ubiquinol oxidase subunit II [Candidatus Binatia bacterium]|nr:ubiquinol oxidase subunit II [Candidatus Binatia bacterium]